VNTNSVQIKKVDPFEPIRKDIHKFRCHKDGRFLLNQFFDEADHIVIEVLCSSCKTTYNFHFAMSGLVSITAEDKKHKS